MSADCAWMTAWPSASSPSARAGPDTRRRPTWRQEGLTYQQYNVLRVIDTQGPIGQAEVARRLLVTAPVVTRLATALAELGLLVRRPDPKDRRAVKLALTPSGRRRARAMR